MRGRPKVGELRQRVTIETPVDIADGAGGFTRSFTPLAQVWAKIEPASAMEQFAEQRLEQSRTLVVTIRWRADVASQMRFDHRGRKLLIRGAIDPDETRRFVKCACEEIT
ncbi:MAG: head-tail adaptor protein [Methylocystis sp.]|nr:MAG: head-tail adaptor protein [Methylocystis sp.]